MPPVTLAPLVHSGGAFLCPNMNVYYEIGFAIGRGKSVAPVFNASFSGAERALRREGTFDNIGYLPYENSDDLTKILSNLPEVNLLDLYGHPIDSSQPLFVLDTFRKTDFRNEIVSSVKESRVFFRSFDPVEIPSFPAIKAIGEATASAGIIVPLLGPLIDDAERHNLRAALLAGLGHGLSRHTLLLERANHEVTTDTKGASSSPSEVLSFAQEWRPHGDSNPGYRESAAELDPPKAGGPRNRILEFRCSLRAGSR
jgi:hypothetical protein